MRYLLLFLLPLLLSAEPQWVTDLAFKRAEEKVEGDARQLKPPVRKIRAYRGNESSMVLHRHGCWWYKCKSCTKVFFSTDAAWEQGYRPCWFCNPGGDR